MIDRKTFDKVLKRFKKVVHSNGHMAALRCVKLEGDGQLMKITGTSIQATVVEKIQATFKGDCCVNHKEIMGALKGMNGGDIHLEHFPNGEENGKLKISSTDGSSCTLSTLPVDEFPVVEGMEEAKPKFNISSEVMGKTLKRCFPFVSDDETRPYICGIHMLTTGDYLRMEAVDGHRLIIENMIPCEQSSRSNFILPRNAIPSLIDKINGHKGTVKVRGSESHLFFGFEDGFISAKKLDAKFPPVTDVVPGSPEIACKVGRKEMLEAAKSAKAISSNGDSSYPAVKLHVAPESIKITLDLPQSGGGFEKSLGCKANGWISMGFNPKYLVDALTILQEESVVLEMKDNIDGMVIHEGSTTIVVMPIRQEKDVNPVVNDPIDTIIGTEETMAEVSAA